MRAILVATTLLLVAGFVVGAAPVASASSGCPEGWTGVRETLPVLGDTGFCCDLREDPSPCRRY